jgi:putative copper export protein
MSWLRAVMLLALIVWIGGIIFFSFVVAPTLFSVLPTRELAGSVVTRCLAALHWMGLISGLVFLLCSIIYNQMKYADARLFSATHGLLVIMLALAAVSQFSITPKMQALRSEMHSIDSTPSGDTRRMEFNRLHAWSTRAEGGVLICGLVVVVLTARRFSS